MTTFGIDRTENTAASRLKIQERTDAFFKRVLREDTLHASPTSTQGSVMVTVADLTQLRDDLAAILRSEGRKSIWSGIAINAAFFVLGLVVGWVPAGWQDYIHTVWLTVRGTR